MNRDQVILIREAVGNASQAMAWTMGKGCRIEGEKKERLQDALRKSIPHLKEALELLQGD